jgi:hypothetical protein
MGELLADQAGGRESLAGVVPTPWELVRAFGGSRPAVCLVAGGSRFAGCASQPCHATGRVRPSVEVGHADEARVRLGFFCVDTHDGPLVWDGGLGALLVVLAGGAICSLAPDDSRTLNTIQQRKPLSIPNTLRLRCL